MTKQEAIDSLTTAKNEMEEDPELECVDTVALMEQAIDDAYSYLMLDADTSKPSPETINKDVLHILRIEHRHGEDMSIYRTEAGAYKALAQYCREWWDEVSDDDMPPDDDEKVIDAYFNNDCCGEHWAIDSSIIHE